METRPPESRNARAVNSRLLFGVIRTVLPSSNSISARPSSLVASFMPSTIGMLRNAFSYPCPVLRSTFTVPSTLLSRTIRTCESAKAGSAANPSVRIKTRAIDVPKLRFDIGGLPKDCVLFTSLDHGLECGVVRLSVTSGQPYTPAARPNPALSAMTYQSDELC